MYDVHTHACMYVNIYVCLHMIFILAFVAYYQKNMVQHDILEKYVDVHYEYWNSMSFHRNRCIHVTCNHSWAASVKYRERERWRHQVWIREWVCVSVDWWGNVDYYMHMLAYSSLQYMFTHTLSHTRTRDAERTGGQGRTNNVVANGAPPSRRKAQFQPPHRGPSPPLSLCGMS